MTVPPCWPRPRGPRTVKGTQKGTQELRVSNFRRHSEATEGWAEEAERDPLLMEGLGRPQLGGILKPEPSGLLLVTKHDPSPH